MTRSEAIREISKHEVRTLELSVRESLLLDWWSIDDSDPGFETLPEDLQEELRRQSEKRDGGSRKYDPLLVLALQQQLAGVTNEYLQKRLSNVGVTAIVTGSIEPMVECPCCGYLSLSSPGTFSVCRVCFWENDGTAVSDDISPTNKMSLSMARENFRVLGAISNEAKRHVLPDGRERYPRAHESIR